MLGRYVLVLAATASTLVACASDGAVTSGGSGASSSAQPGTGVLTGIVRVYGGPLDPTTGKAARNGEPNPGNEVTVTSTSGAKTRTTSDAEGRFTFQLAPGTYTLACSAVTQPIVIKTGGTIDTDCQIDVP